jgi:hypothetical protein
MCDCGSIFSATIIQKDCPIEGDFLAELEQYAKEGYSIHCKDASTFRLSQCTCKK